MSRVSDILGQFVTAERSARMEAVLDHRTRHLAPVFERVWDPHNISACLRSAEALGIQEVHVVEADTPFRPSKDVVQGSAKWLDIIKHKSSTECVQALKERGFTVAAGALTDDAVPLTKLDFGGPVALAFGNEHEGLSPEFMARCDVAFRIPMLGFTQSLNISVSAAVSLYHGVLERIRLLGGNGDLTEAQKDQLRDEWLVKTVPMAKEILQRCGIR